jgi:thioredoxin reductase
LEWKQRDSVEDKFLQSSNFAGVYVVVRRNILSAEEHNVIDTEASQVTYTLNANIIVFSTSRPGVFRSAI